MANTFCGFDIDRIESLRRELVDASQAAGRMSTAVSRLVSQAAALQMSGPLLRAERADGGVSQPRDPNRAGLSILSADGPVMAAEIGRRRAQLIACQQLALTCFAVDPDVVFADEPPPDQAKINDALSLLTGALASDGGFNGNQDDMARVTAALGGLTAAETDSVVRRLSDDDLRRWDAAITRGDGLLSSNGLDSDERMRLASLLLARVGRASLARLAADMPSLEPSFDIEMNTDGVELVGIDGDLFTDGVSPLDVHQGNAGDCWFLAALEAVALQDPKFVADHVHLNLNGTYTVTLYRDGKPVDVTVDNRLPQRDGAFTMAHGADDWKSDHDLWVAIYEKAFAAYKGGYGATEGGFGSQAFPVITGQPAVRLPGGVSLAELEKLQKTGVTLTVGTGNDKFLGLWGGSEFVDDGRLVTNHEYTVKGFDTSTDPPTVILWNPWGTGGATPQEVRLTQDQFDDYIDSVSVSGHFGG